MFQCGLTPKTALVNKKQLYGEPSGLSHALRHRLQLVAHQGLQCSHVLEVGRVVVEVGQRYLHTGGWLLGESPSWPSSGKVQRCMRVRCRRWDAL